MPGIPLVARETANCVCNCSYSRGADHMCRQDPRAQLSPEEQIAAEESLSIYCKPVELYNILQRRAVRNPSFLQRCLGYKIQARHKRRIQMTISLPSTVNDESQIQSLFPLCIMIARPVYNPAVVEDSAVYRFNRECILTKCSGDGAINRDEAHFILPEINKLSAEVKSGSLSILFVSCAELFKEHLGESLFPANDGSDCFLGKIPMEKSLKLSRGKRAEILSTVELHSCFLKTGCFGEDKCFSFHSPHAGVLVCPPFPTENNNIFSVLKAMLMSLEDVRLLIIVFLVIIMCILSGLLKPMSQRLQVRITAEEVGLRERSPYDTYSFSGIPSSTLPQIMRLRTGNVIFNYRYYNNKLQRTEVTEDFACPFCLVKCASFKGLRYHLPACHDLFSFEFWVTEEFQAVNVSVKTDTWRPEIVAAGVDPKQQTFFFCSKAPWRKKMKRSLQNPKYVYPLVLDSEIPGSAIELREKTFGVEESADRDASSPRGSATAHSYADPECVQSLPGNNLAHPALLQFAKTRKLSAERSDPRNRALLQKRQFFHSHRAQPMAVEQVLSDRDSEDEVDDDVADLEDRRMLDDFVDVTKDEKQMMHLWNSFVRKQRVLADGHIPWACEAFSKLHRQDLVQKPALLWCWRLFMIKLWNHGLLDARTMNSCNIVLEQSQGISNGEDMI